MANTKAASCGFLNEAANMIKINLNFGIEYTDAFSPEFAAGAGDGVLVDLPHTVAVTPYNYFDEAVYQKVVCYRKKIEVPDAWKDKRIFLNVGGAAHEAEVFANGKSVLVHRGGYTAFRAELTKYAKPGETLTVAVKVDSRESLDIPPFGNVIDYMTYGGIYREMWLEVENEEYIENLFVTARPDGGTGKVVCRGTYIGGDEVRAAVYDGERAVAEGTFSASDEIALEIPDVKLWDVDSPNLYTLTATLYSNGRETDKKSVRFGVRTARFEADGFYLNGRRLELVGLDRHQSFPYVGYAMPSSAQRRDADILKYELGVSIVRTSHYPQSQHFIDRCDETGLLVFTEIPGWQHIGGAAWKDVAVENVREMVTQYRNHPSVVLWGVRINESVDDDGFYERTNKAARELDPTRQTAGVRRLKKGNLLEDVFTYNDFLHDGAERGCEKKKDVTSDMSRGYLVTEFNGHMFPTKTYDSEPHRLEHALRHANVLDAVAGEPDIAGALGWCMFDYNTHRDFGSGDRICYHGVLDMFRNPKCASYVYSEMKEDGVFLEVSSTMDIGEHPAGRIGKAYIFTNADSVRMYKNGEFIREFTHADSPYKSIKNPPVAIDDYVGDRIEKGEGFSHRRAKFTKDILNHSALYGFSRLPLSIKLKAAWLMIRYRMTFNDAYGLYGKYIGNWGDSATTFRFDAVSGGKVVKSITKSPVTSVTLSVESDRTELTVGETYDVACVRIRAVDQNGNVLPYYNEPVSFKTEGGVRLIGPALTSLRGGLGGTFVRTVTEGEGALTVSAPGAPDVTVNFKIFKKSTDLV